MLEYAVLEPDENKTKFLYRKYLDTEPELCIKLYQSIDKNIIQNEPNGSRVFNLITIAVAADDKETFFSFDVEVPYLLESLYLGAVYNKNAIEWLNDINGDSAVFLSSMIQLSTSFHMITCNYKSAFRVLLAKSGLSEEEMSDRIFKKCKSLMFSDDRLMLFLDMLLQSGYFTVERLKEKYSENEWFNLWLAKLDDV